METPLQKPPTRFGLPLVVWLGLGLSIVAMDVAWGVLGINLGFYFFGIVVAALIVPPLSLAETGLVDRLLIAGAIIDGVAIVWLIAALASPLTLAQWALSYALLICWGFALVGASHALERLLPNSIVASAIVVVLALLWLAWPIWLSQVGPPLMVSLHPLFSINGILINLGVWPERPIAYQHLMRLGQDVTYSMPRSIAPAAAVHLLVGAVGLAVGRVRGKS